MQKDFAKAGKEVDGLIAKFAALSASSKLIVAGLAAGGAGLAIAMGFNKANKAADKYLKIQSDIISNGAKGGQLAAIESAANDNSKFQNLSKNEKMANGAEAFALTRDAGRNGSIEHTEKLIPILNALDSIAKNSGQHYSHADKANFTKILEMGGAFNNGADLKGMADKYYRLMASGNGTMKNGTLLSILKADPIDINNLSANALGRSEPLMQEMSSGFGVGLRMIEQRLQAHVGLGGPMGGYQMKALRKMGVFDKNDKVIDSQTLSTDYDMWIRKHMADFYKAYGAKTMADRRHVDYLVGGSSGSKIINRVQSQSDQMDASGASVAAQHGMDSDLANKGSPLERMKTTVAAQLSTLLTNIGLVSLPIFIEALKPLNAMLIALNASISAHKAMFDAVIKGILGLSAALMTMGVLALATGLTMKFVGTLKGFWLVLGMLWKVASPVLTVLRFVALAFVDLVGWPIALGVALVAAGVAIYVFRDKIVSVFSGLWNWIVCKLGSLGKLLGITPDKPANVKTASDAGKNSSSGDVYLDGKKVGKILDPHLAKGVASRANSNTFDGSLSPASPAMSFMTGGAG